MRTGNLSAQGMSGEFNVLLAKVAGHFQVFKPAQGDGTLALRTGNFPAEITSRKCNVSATMYADGFQRNFFRLGQKVPDQQGGAAGEQV